MAVVIQAKAKEAVMVDVLYLNVMIIHNVIKLQEKLALVPVHVLHIVQALPKFVIMTITKMKVKNVMEQI
jgi:hypothetical protein